ncbi:DUF7689 domain-containing protein [Maribacter stanieri]|uniref:DUF7689 domain-containing protein n=1 Tax=Maribacter stanieri TaxID=440514 RepID=UPI002494E324|nr:hypothetical protein [Maribacter stanieri]
MLDSAQNRSSIIKAFPKLKDDKSFKIVDKANPNYNCIAWAANVTDCWWANIPKNERPKVTLDGVKIDWPFEVEDEFSISALVQIFTSLKFIECENWEYEEGFKKIAFYKKGNNATHAARQLTYGKHKGIWSSKLGGSFLIHHETPHTIESIIYGKPVLYMKQNMR